MKLKINISWWWFVAQFIAILCKIYNRELREFVMIHEEGDMITVQGQITDVGEVLGYVLRSHTFIGE